MSVFNMADHVSLWNRHKITSDCMCETLRERERHTHTCTHTNTEVFCSVFVQLVFFMFSCHIVVLQFVKLTFENNRPLI